MQNLKYVVFLIGILSIPFPLQASLEETIKEEVGGTKDKVYYPASLAHRSLITPEQILEVGAVTHYRNVLNGPGVDFHFEGSYGFYRDMAAIAGIRTIAASQPGSFKSGGMTVGALFRLLSEHLEYPETIVGLKLAALGYTEISENKGSPVLLMPSVKAKKGLTDAIAVTAETVFGIGKEVGLVKLRGGGISKLHPLFDAALYAEWTNLGFPEPTAVTITPALYYHFKQILDLSAGVDIALYGGSSIGNNLRLGVAAAF
ncbi:MAG: hypothetical protein HY391_03605 [Deltaproteobacteria bacterium]|nr:hypothetical protein [Deltaproteobacteria bacterium]